MYLLPMDASISTPTGLEIIPLSESESPKIRNIILSFIGGDSTHPWTEL